MIALSFSLQSCSTDSHLEHGTARIEAVSSDVNHLDLSNKVVKLMSCIKQEMFLRILG